MKGNGGLTTTLQDADSQKGCDRLGRLDLHVPCSQSILPQFCGNNVFRKMYQVGGLKGG